MGNWVCDGHRGSGQVYLPPFVCICVDLWINCCCGFDYRREWENLMARINIHSSTRCNLAVAGKVDDYLLKILTKIQYL